MQWEGNKNARKAPWANPCLWTDPLEKKVHFYLFTHRYVHSIWFMFVLKFLYTSWIYSSAIIINYAKWNMSTKVERLLVLWNLSWIFWEIFLKVIHCNKLHYLNRYRLDNCERLPIGWVELFCSIWEWSMIAIR